ncbi:MAG: 5'-methylthioadenosine/adenosylhomocysteine nucleosidase [Ruminococcaceae bacterium]|nr:5'-methylthioadenosine/adenosylhomocysteine nucleosidase [Oscillospiraceae bacterium]
MLTVGIICAMNKEIAYIKEKFNATLIEEKHSIYEAFYEGKRIIACVSGIGKVNSAVATQRLIFNFSVDYIINVGIAGGLNKSLSVLDMVIAEETVYHDFHPLELLEQENGLGTYIFKCDNRLITLAEKACEKMKESGKIKNFTKGRILSGDCFVESDEVSRRLRDEMKGECVEMEGASISQTCILNEVPFLVLRSISDFADNGAEMSYDTFAVKAAEQAGEVLCEIINGL